MPRIDRGWIAIDISEIINNIIQKSYKETEKLLEWARAEEAIAVISPSPVIISLSNRIIRITLGIGSLISENTPPIPIKYYVLNRPEWVDGCKIRNSRSRIMLEPADCATCDRRREEGVIKVIDYKDPILATINGMKGIFTITHYKDNRNAIIKAMVNDKPALISYDDKYVTLLEDNYIIKIIEYNILTIGTCI